MSVAVAVDEVVGAARGAARVLAGMSGAAKDALLRQMADAVEAGGAAVLEANARDMAAAAAAGTRPALLDRLRLTAGRVASMVEAVRDIAALSDPVGSVSAMSRRPNGMLVGRMRVPIGVILMIYEARPSVTLDAAALCLKAGNAVLLRGGSEARETLAALGRLIVGMPGLPVGAVQILAGIDHAAVDRLLQSDAIDLVIPRGGERLIRAVTERARMPVLKHFKGVCHMYVDRDADLEMAERLVVNAKVQRPSVCNALETVLVDRAVAPRFLPGMVDALRASGVEVRGCDETRAIAPAVVPATEEDWDTEYLDLIVSVRVVADIDEAIDHIRRHSSGLAEAIVTDRLETSRRFVSTVDSAAVLVNASTRLVDGAEFGLGAEIGISTDRLGPRGPMGPEELTTTKWVVLGSGQIRE